MLLCSYDEETALATSFEYDAGAAGDVGLCPPSPPLTVDSSATPSPRVADDISPSLRRSVDDGVVDDVDGGLPAATVGARAVRRHRLTVESVFLLEPF